MDYCEGTDLNIYLICCKNYDLHKLLLVVFCFCFVYAFFKKPFHINH